MDNNAATISEVFIARMVLLIFELNDMEYPFASLSRERRRRAVARNMHPETMFIYIPEPWLPLEIYHGDYDA